MLCDLQSDDFGSSFLVRNDLESESNAKSKKGDEQWNNLQETYGGLAFGFENGTSIQNLII